jgi:ketopantoate reductase
VWDWGKRGRAVGTYCIVSLLNTKVIDITIVQRQKQKQQKGTNGRIERGKEASKKGMVHNPTAPTVALPPIDLACTDLQSSLTRQRGQLRSVLSTL